MTIILWKEEVHFILNCGILQKKESQIQFLSWFKDGWDHRPIDGCCQEKKRPKADHQRQVSLYTWGGTKSLHLECWGERWQLSGIWPRGIPARCPQWVPSGASNVEARRRWKLWWDVTGSTEMLQRCYRDVTEMLHRCCREHSYTQLQGAQCEASSHRCSYH